MADSTAPAVPGILRNLESRTSYPLSNRCEPYRTFPGKLYAPFLFRALGMRSHVVRPHERAQHLDALANADETRRQGMCLLRDGGIPGAEGFTDYYPVPGTVVAAPDGRAASLTENAIRTPL